MPDSGVPLNNHQTQQGPTGSVGAQLKPTTQLRYTEQQAHWSASPSTASLDSQPRTSSCPNTCVSAQPGAGPRAQHRSTLPQHPPPWPSHAAAAPQPALTLGIHNTPTQPSSLLSQAAAAAAAEADKSSAGRMFRRMQTAGALSSPQALAHASELWVPPAQELTTASARPHPGAPPVPRSGRHLAQHPGAPVPSALLAELQASTRISGGAAAPRAGRADQRRASAALQRPQQPQPANAGIAPRVRPANLVTRQLVMPDLSYSQHLLNLLAVGAEQQAEGLGSSSRMGVLGAGPRAAALAAVEPGPVKAQTPALCEVEEEARAEAGLQRWSLAVVNKQAEQCCVCLDTMGEGQTVRMLSCGHRLHSACLRQYLHGRHECVCPMCRAVNA